MRVFFTYTRGSTTTWDTDLFLLFFNSIPSQPMSLQINYSEPIPNGVNASLIIRQLV